MTAKPDQPNVHGRLSNFANRKLLIALFCAGFSTFAQLYAPQALLPQLTTAWDISRGQAGLVVSMGTIGLAIGVIPWVLVASRIGTVRAMRAAVVVGTVCTLLTSVAPGYEWALALRFLTGLAVGAVPALALAHLNTRLPPHSAAKAAGLYIAGNSLGGLVGRIMAGAIASTLGWQLGLLMVSGTAAVAALGFLMLIPNEKTGMQRSQSIGQSHNIGHNFGQGQGQGQSQTRAEAPSKLRWAQPFLTNLRSPAQLKIFTQGFLIMGAFVTIYNYMGYRLQEDPFYLPPIITTAVFAVYLFGTFASIYATALVTRFGRSRVLSGTGILVGVGIVVTLLPYLAAQVGGLVLATMGFFAGQAIASGWASSGISGTEYEATEATEGFKATGATENPWEPEDLEHSQVRQRLDAIRPPTAISLPQSTDNFPRSQAGALYTLAYYTGGSVMGWLGGELFEAFGWPGTVGLVALLAVTSAGLALTMGGDGDRLQSKEVCQEIGAVTASESNGYGSSRCTVRSPHQEKP